MIRRGGLPIIITLGLVALCAGDVTAARQHPRQVPTQIELDPAEATLQVGETLQLVARVLDAQGQAVETEILYLSRDRRSLEVSSTGLVTAHAAGRHAVVVLVPSDDTAADARPILRGRVLVRVPTPPAASIALGELPQHLYVGSRLRLSPRIVDVTGAVRTDLMPLFRSSDPAIASVDAFGYLTLRATGRARIEVGVERQRAAREIEVEPNPVRDLELGSSAEAARTGDVVHFEAVPRAADSSVVAGVPIQWAMRARTDDPGLRERSSGLVDEQGAFVANRPGEYTIVAVAAGVAASRTVTITPRNVARPIELVGQGPVRDRFTSDLWVWEAPDGRDYALTGTWGAQGHAYLWDVTDARNMQRIDTIKVDARTVNDVKVSEDGRIAVISREGASNRRNGLVILDVSNPQDGMKVLARYDDQLTGGVHNVFLYQDHIYALSAGRRYDVINIEDPTRPHRVGRFELNTPGHSIHDVWVQDGIAWSSNWDDGVVAVDVGGGNQGGSPRHPVMMGSYFYPSGWNHAAFPYHSQSTGKLYVFAGDEAVIRGVEPGLQKGLDLMDGYIHVIDWGDGSSPRQVARYQVPEAGSHNLWVEDDILYIAYYQGGLRAVDVSGELLGDLYRQGREIGYFKAIDPHGHIPNVPMAWGPQPHKGLIFFSDFHSGLWAVRFARP